MTELKRLLSWLVEDPEVEHVVEELYNSFVEVADAVQFHQPNELGYGHSIAFKEYIIQPYAYYSDGLNSIIYKLEVRKDGSPGIIHEIFPGEVDGRAIKVVDQHRYTGFDERHRDRIKELVTRISEYSADNNQRLSWKVEGDPPKSYDEIEGILSERVDSYQYTGGNNLTWETDLDPGTRESIAEVVALFNVEQKQQFLTEAREEGTWRSSELQAIELMPARGEDTGGVKEVHRDHILNVDGVFWLLLEPATENGPGAGVGDTVGFVVMGSHYTGTVTEELFGEGNPEQVTAAKISLHGDIVPFRME